MARRCRLLVAVTMLGYAHVSRALRGTFDLVPVFSRTQALTAIKQGGIDAIVCGVHFEESRMLDFLVAVKAVAPEMPFVCCQLLTTNLSESSLGAAVSAAESQGALGFIDYNAVLRARSTAEADRFLRAEILRLLPRRLDCADGTGTVAPSGTDGK